MINDDNIATSGSNENMSYMGSFSEKTNIPSGIIKKLHEVDWSVKDVLVGSLGSVKQFEDNLNKNYYYVPAKHIGEGDLPVKYIALAQSKTMFGSNAGIRYFAEIIETKLIPRKDIKFPMRRNNGDEMYYAFRTSAWKKLPVTVDVRYCAVSEPMFTNSFLLEHCSHSYELFCIGCAEQYLLFRELTLFFSYITNVSDPQFETVKQFKNGKSIWIHNGYIDVFDENGSRVFEHPMKSSDFVNDPKSTLCTLSDKLM